MTNSINIKGVTSYHPTEAQRIDISKNNTFIFGLNGTGKSTISNFLYDQVAYPSCSLVIDGNYTPIVYNQAFVEENFVKNHEQAGVFTLSKDNADIERKISNKSKLREKLATAYRTTDAELAKANNRIKEENAKAVKEIYKKKEKIQGTALEPFLTGFKTPKLKFYEQVKKQTETEGVSIEALAKELQELNKYDGKPPSKVYLPHYPTISDEDIVLLSQPIIGSSSSQLSDFISELDNQGWVKLGKDLYLNDGQTRCPFCQKNTIDDSFQQELMKLFDKTYEGNLDKIVRIESTYKDGIETYIEELKAAFTGCSVYDPVQHDALPLIELLESEFLNNLAIISSKVKNPAISVELGSTDERLAPINGLTSQLNETVSAIEARTNKFRETKGNIETRMWKALKHQSQDILSLEEQANDKIRKEIAALDARLSRIKAIGQTVRNKINDLRSQTSNIDETIDRINDNLKYLGVTGFEIVKSNAHENNNFFMLSRGANSGEGIFKSLSEGEKTLITFLYYIEKCNGSMSKDSEVPDSEKLIVIDDPISSLSQNYIYDIASLIQSKIIKGNRFKKVVILTHSLFFYHELLKLAPRNQEKFQAKYGLYLVSKNEYSQISTLEPKELKNDYQSLWHILKDVVNSKTDPVILPNVMRNILEYYFGFVHKKDQLSDILNKLAENEPNQGFKSFYRYINRESHSDPTNIGFMMDVQPQIYLDRFKSVFVESNDVAHYECMMQ